MTQLKLDIPTLYPDLGRAADYDYFILVEEMTLGTFSCENYGVRIVSRSTGEEASLPRITPSATRIDQLMELLVRNQVSPLHLRDVVDDWL